MIQLSNPVRLAVRQEFASQFNAQLALACAPLGLTPFEIDFATPGKNYFDGPLDLNDFLSYLEENPDAVPALCLYGIKLGTDRRTVARFSGNVAIGGAVFLRYPVDATDFESLKEAVEAAITGIIHESDTDDWGHGTYENDLRFTSSGLVFHNGSFYRTISFSMSFQITAN
jgi:hypothetical protein